ncbi:MAG: pyridoxal kinase PdxY [Alphaproteobacteria bacterium]|nr:pyridoxal kinase PdxY [Alphaproteobacteria bacterium]
MSILSIQSNVVAGHVGNSAAGPALQRLGYTVWRLDTVHFSNHPAHGHHTGRVVAASAMADLVEGLDRRGIFGDCEAAISGYLGDAATGPVVIDAVDRVRRQRPDALYLCDPVIGDHGERYVRDGLEPFFRDAAVPAADIVTPNPFEAECLTGQPVASVDDALRACDSLRTMGPAMAVVTGVERNGEISIVGTTDEAAWIVTTPKVSAESFGAGDLFAALLLGRYLQDRRLDTAIAAAASAVHGVLVLAAKTGARDLPLIAAQDLLVNPPRDFPAEKLRQEFN